MKIGIVTFWWGNDNYGQLLQCWALQQHLKKMGHEPFLIRYKPVSPSPCMLRKVIKTLLVYPCIKERVVQKKRKIHLQKLALLEGKNEIRQFDAFRSENLIMSDRVYRTLDELRHNPPQADAYIVGSDQVWAQLLGNRNNLVYFLAFGDKSIRRIAYAPSFSMDEYPNEFRTKLKKALSGMDTISVRETSGKMICRKLGYDAEVVCDPTMLLVKEDYLRLLPSRETGSIPYVFVYSLNVKEAEEMKWQALKVFAAEKKWNVRVTVSSGYYPGEEIYDVDTDYDYCNIGGWLANIQNASLVVTPSFHGIVFSLLFQRPFVYVPLEGEWSRGNRRIYDLLESVGLTDRVFTSGRVFSDFVQRVIDWDKVESRMKDMRILSSTFLSCALAE